MSVPVTMAAMRLHSLSRWLEMLVMRETDPGGARAMRTAAVMKASVIVLMSTEAMGLRMPSAGARTVVEVGVWETWQPIRSRIWAEERVQKIKIK